MLYLKTLIIHICCQSNHDPLWLLDLLAQAESNTVVARLILIDVIIIFCSRPPSYLMRMKITNLSLD
jgi:hypothetical protein